MTGEENEPASASGFTDSPEQARVVNASGGEDMLVVAGAGSGKTYTMTRRIVDLISRGVPAEKILGLTFTRKAASELLGRVAAAVDRSGDGSSSGFRAFLKPEVLTYDAFFQSIVRRYGLLVGFDQSTQPLSEAGAWQLAVQVIDEHMDEVDPQEFGGFKTLVRQVLDLSSAIGGSMIGSDIVSVDDAIDRVRSWDAAFMERLSKVLEGQEIPEEEPKPGKLRKRTKKESDEHFEGRRREYRSLWHDLSVYRTSQLSGVAGRREVLLGLVQAFSERKQRLNMAEFSDFTVAAYALVTRFPSIGERLRRQYTHVLLDEYQDTSTTQASLLAALFHPASTGETGGDDAPRRSSVSAVGDPFQSIYAWRGASPGAFRLFIHDFDLSESYRPYPLSVTRRNARVVLEAANNLTLSLRLPRSVPGSSLMHEVPVAPLSTLDSAPEGTLGVLGYQTLGQEIDAVARFAQAAIARHAQVGPDGRHESSKAHVAVLFRSKAAMASFAQGLERHGLTTAVVGYSAVLERADVRDVLALLHVVADHTDSAALMRLLATPRFGVGASDLETLAALAGRCNDEYRFRALVQAGLAGADTPAGLHRKVVADHRDKVPNIVFLTDLLCDSKLDGLLRNAALSPSGADAISRAGRMLRQVQDVANHPLAQVLRTAVEALGLDVDTVVAQAMRNPESSVDPARARSAFDALISLVDTYTSEIAEDQTPSLRGFIGWVDSLSNVRDDSAASADDPVDVVLMTIHQAKGLEWDAVAVVGLRRRGFPSSQGDNLAVDVDEDHMGGMKDGGWEPPQYRESARTWLDNPAAVPAPVRVDSGILPRFPHDCMPGLSDEESLAGLDSVERVTDESEGLMRGVAGLEDDAPDGDYLSQSQEYGRRLHADERRLAYVAITRAREEVLLTYSRSSDTAMYTDAGQAGRGSQRQPSNFWTEILDSVVGRDDAVSAASMVPPEGGDSGADAESDAETLDHTFRGLPSSESGGMTLAQLGVQPPEGVFVGEHAGEFCRTVVQEAWNGELEEEDGAVALPWPSQLSPELNSKLDFSVSNVRAAQREGVASQECGQDDADSLLARTRVLLADPDLAAQYNGVDLDEDVRRRGAKLLESRRQNVTSLQARAGRMNERESREYWRSLVRPIPQVSSPAAEAGTRFHAWAEQFVGAYLTDAGGDDESGGEDVIDGGGSVASGTYRPSRASLIADLERRKASGGEEHEPVERRIEAWESRLVGSRWASRRPFAAEYQIVAAINGTDLDGSRPQIVNGKLDAVFYGGLDERDTSKRFTVVDWKTGHKPTSEDDVERKLSQLDMYRLLLSASTGVPLNQIDATLYYLSESAESDREIHAQGKTQTQILGELAGGTIEEESDND